MYESCGYGMSRIAYGPGYFSAGKEYPLQNYAHNQHPLDSIVSHASIELPRRTTPAYVPATARTAYLTGRRTHEYFTTNPFIKQVSTARFVGDAKEIQEEIKQAFRQTTGQELPEDIEITVLPEKEFINAHTAHNGRWSEGSASQTGRQSSGAPPEGIQGFSLNGPSRKVFAKANPLDRLMLTIGHEIGHVLTPTLPDARDEEAKAFAFSLAWMKAIRENNIAGIGQNILPTPAQNGLHDKAFDFVQRLISTGTKAIDAFVQLAKGIITIREQPQIIEG